MDILSWDIVQQQSDEILSDGLFNLKSQQYIDFANIKEKKSGNYLITLYNIPYYIGEGENLSKRIKQQSVSTTSTFYRNFNKFIQKNQEIRHVPIDSFKIQYMQTNFGRKEIEEFGIVNLPTKLNRFQLDKRRKYVIEKKDDLWCLVQNSFIELLKKGERKVFESSFTNWFDTDILSKAGLYLVKDKMNKLIYIGESSNIGERITIHSEQTYFSALRRHVGTDILGLSLQERNKKKRYFDDSDDKRVTEYLKTCKVAILPVCLGRYELEEYLIRNYRPFLNRKDNK